MGFEPTTASLEGWNSTTELRPPFSSSVLNSSCCLLLPDIQYLPASLPIWWAGKDSNLGSRWQQIYSLPPLATWVPARNTCTRIKTKSPNEDRRARNKNKPAHARLLLLNWIRMNLVSCKHRLVYETLNSIDEVWPSQDQKLELSCFSPKLSIMEFFLAASFKILRSSRFTSVILIDQTKPHFSLIFI
jgi:hypothetical protein